MNQDAAQVLALQALAWLAADEALLPTFLSVSGADLQELRARANDPQFLAAVLDFLLQDDAWVIAFCDAQGHPYTLPLTARAALPGSEALDWA